MYKELIISIIIVFFIFSLDFITQRFTDSTINSTIDELSKLKEEIDKKDVNYEKSINKVNEIYTKWQEEQDKLAFYIEHNELEKVQTNLISGKSFIETKKYEEAIAELEKTKFILQHINQKYSFDLKNIF